jgi:hypothetical protein
MGAYSDYLENKLIDHTLRNVAYTPATTVYLALFTSSANASQLETNTITNEVTGSGYARQSVTFSAAASGGTSNSATVTFSNLPATTLGFIAVMDASTAGNVLYYAQLGSPVSIAAGDGYQINSGGFTVQLD